MLTTPVMPSRKSSPIGLSSDRKSTRLNSSHLGNSYAVFCLKKKKTHRRGHLGRGGRCKRPPVRRHHQWDRLKSHSRRIEQPTTLGLLRADPPVGHHNPRKQIKD